jgi:hypothetical protein
MQDPRATPSPPSYLIDILKHVRHITVQKPLVKGPPIHIPRVFGKVAFFRR